MVCSDELASVRWKLPTNRESVKLPVVWVTPGQPSCVLDCEWRLAWGLVALACEEWILVSSGTADATSKIRLDEV